MKSSLAETSHDFHFLMQDLKECLNKATPVEALIIMPLIKQASDIHNTIDALINAREGKL